MIPGRIVIVDLDGVPALGRITAARPSGLRVEVEESGGTRIVRQEREAVLAKLTATASHWSGVTAIRDSALSRVGHADLSLAWQLLEGQPVGLGELARLLLGNDQPDSRDAVMLALALDDDGFFLQSGQAQRRTAEERTAHVERRRHQLEVAAEVAPAVAALLALRAGAPGGRELLRGWAARTQAWIGGKADDAVQALLSQANPSKIPQPADAAQFLVEIGCWDGHDDVQLLGSGVLSPPPTWTPDSDVAASGQLLETLDLPFVTVDNDAPHEVDDAVYAEAQEAGIRVWVAIAHPTRFFGPDDPIDADALQRGATFYHPRYVAGMLCDPLSREGASLLVGRSRPALVFCATVDEQGRLRDPWVGERQIAVQRAFCYAQVDAEAEGGKGPQPLVLLTEAASRLEQRRIGEGAYLLYKPECDVSAPRHQAVQIVASGQSSPARRMITEAMILAGEVAAEYACRHHIALPFRHQAPPAQPPLAPGLYTDPAEVFSVLRCLAPAQTSLQPKRHGVMAVPAYAQVTSPLRRYVDLLAHRQLAAHLRGAPGMSPSQLSERIQISETASALRRQWQRRADRYFKLVWLLSRHPEERQAACVVRTHAHGAGVFLPHLSLEVSLRRRDLRCGDQVELRIIEIRPRDDRAEFEVC